MKKCNENIEKVLKLSYKMLELANKGDENRNDSSCGILYGILRDYGYKLQKVAAEEKQKHIENNKWD